MKNRISNKRALALTLAGTLMIGSLSGCGSILASSDATKYPLQAALTAQEVMDFYAESMEYDTVVSRETAEDTNYVVFDVTDSDMQSKLMQAVKQTETLLKESSYNPTADQLKYLDTSVYHYIRATLNDKSLAGGTITKMTQALGYYFVDVEYSIRPANIGSFTAASSLLGIRGAFIHSGYYNTDEFDNAFMDSAVKSLNEYYLTNKISKTASYNAGSNELSIVGADGSNAYTVGSGVSSNSVIEGSAITGDGISNYDPTAGIADGNYIASTDSSRTPKIDLNEFHNIAGMGKSSSYMPEISMVYNIPESNGSVSGIGAYPCGDAGLKLFGYDRSDLSGSMTLRYVYKQDLLNPNQLISTNVYVVNWNIDTGFSETNDNQIPEFLNTTFSVLIDRADRAAVNVDITGLAGGHIYSDLGQAVLVGYTDQYSNLLRQLSTLRRVVSRDIEKNAYLIEVETYREEGPKTPDVYATYKDKVYMVIQQSGSEFIITDYMIMNRQMVSEPDITPDDTIAKRVIALGLTGEVNDSTKASVEELLDSLYTASTNRILTGPATVGDVTIERGMYDCFNSNVSMLSSADKESMNSKLRNYLTKYGVDKSSEMNGVVTEWIGGADNQVEFTTEELITYQGRNEGTYLTCYYLVSNMEDSWVIDEITVLSEETLTGDELQSAISRIVPNS